MNIINYSFFIGTGLMFLLFIMYFFFFYKKKDTFFHYSLNLQIKKIVIIALFAATSTSMLFVLSQFTSATVLPPVRVSFAGVLIKISGFLFGPFIGVLCALVTEISILLFIPGYFHYKYLFVLLCFGFFSGLIKKILESPLLFRNNKLKAFLILFGLLFFFSLTQFFFFFSLDNQWDNLFTDWTKKWLLFQNIYLENFNFMSITFFGNLIAFFVIFTFVILLLFALFIKFKLPFINQKTIPKILSILILTIFAEYFISIFISTNANQATFGESAKTGTVLLTTAFLLAPIKILINTFIIYRVCSAFSKHIDKQLKGK